MLVPSALVYHKESPLSRETEYLMARKDAVTRLEIFRRYGRKTFFGRLWFAWASFGWILRQALVFHWSGVAGRVHGFATGTVE